MAKNKRGKRYRATPPIHMKEHPSGATTDQDTSLIDRVAQILRRFGDLSNISMSDRDVIM